MVLGALLAVFFTQVLKVAKHKPIAPKQATEEDWESADDTEDEQIKPPKTPTGYDEALFQTYPIKDLKMMMAVRNDLGMTKGKIGA